MSNKLNLMNAEEKAAYLEGFLIENLSQSSIKTFQRNQKAFEKKYIFRISDNYYSLASIIGNVYHKSLAVFFSDLAHPLGYDELMEVAHNELELVGADRYSPVAKKSIDEQKQAALKAVNSLITSFMQEVEAYLELIDRVIFVEGTFERFIDLGGVEIPVPVKVTPDVVFIDKQGRLCILDHKSKHAYTAEKDVVMQYHTQAKIYAKVVGSALAEEFPNGVEAFYFFENKYSRNADGSNQIRKIPVDVTGEAGEFYEQMILEPVSAIMKAVQDPDHVYLMNPADYFENGEEIMEFWAKTHLEGLDGFPKLRPNQRRILENRRKDIRRAAFSKIPKSLIEAFTGDKKFLTYSDMSTLSPVERIEHRLRTFGYPVKIEHVIEGYSCDTYLVQVQAGQKITTIYGYEMDIANALGVDSVRIPRTLIQRGGQSFVAIEVKLGENRRELKFDKRYLKDNFAFPLAVTNYNEPIYWNIENPSTPHMMIAGASGSGKSTVIKTVIEVALAKGVRVIVIDPKRMDFGGYAARGVHVIHELKDIEALMEAKVAEMDKIFRTSLEPEKQLIIFDEAADCFARQTQSRKIEKIIKENPDYNEDVARALEARGEGTIEKWIKKSVKDENFKTLEQNVLLLAQKARSAGIHLLLAAQRFSVKVLTGDAKANFPTRLCLTVASATDSKVMLDVAGAEKLNGKGDGLFTSPELSEPVRVQCFQL